MSVDGKQTKDERELADRCYEIIKMRPGQTTLSLLANANRGQPKNNLASPDEIFRACASDDRIDAVLGLGTFTYHIRKTT